MTTSVDSLLEQFTGVRPPPAPGAEIPLVLPAVAAAGVEGINAFYRPRAPLSFTLGTRVATFTAAWPPAEDRSSPRCRVEVTLAGVPAEVIVPRRLIRALVTDVDEYQHIDVDGRHLALLIEFALAPALPALETALGARLAVTAVGAEAGPPDASSLFFTLAADGLAPAGGELRLPPGHAVRLARILDLAAAAAVPAIDVPLPACLRVAAATCPVGEVATLVPGDVVLVDHACHAGTAVMVVGEHLAAPVRFTTAGAEIAEPPSRVQGSLWEWSMENGADRPQAEEKTDFNDIPLKLLFELGRVELPLGELHRLAPGAVIPLPRTVEESVDISANGRRIGRGTLVRIGDSLGVRITRLFHHG